MMHQNTHRGCGTLWWSHVALRKCHNSIHLKYVPQRIQYKITKRLIILTISSNSLGPIFNFLHSNLRLFFKEIAKPNLRYTSVRVHLSCGEHQQNEVIMQTISNSFSVILSNLSKRMSGLYQTLPTTTVRCFVAQ